MININHNYSTPIRYNYNLSNKYKSNILIKYENELPGNSFIYRLYTKLINNIKENSVIVCYDFHLCVILDSFKNTNKKIYIFTTEGEDNEINKIKNKNIIIKYFGNNLLDTIEYAKKFSDENKLIYIDLIQNSEYYQIYNDICKEISENVFFKNNIDYILLSGCNGGLIRSLSNFFIKNNRKTKIIPVKFNKNNTDFQKLFFEKIKGKNITHKSIKIKNLYKFILEFYLSDSFLIEETSAMPLCALNTLEIKGKNVICIITEKIKNIKSIQKILNKSI